MNSKHAEVIKAATQCHHDGEVFQQALRTHDEEDLDLISDEEDADTSSVAGEDLGDVNDDDVRFELLVFTNWLTASLAVLYRYRNSTVHNRRTCPRRTRS